LTAYTVATGPNAPGAGELRGFLQERLPGYMVPALFIPLASLPLSVHGKVDRGALPRPAAELLEPEGELATPRTREEEVLARVWAEALGLRRVGIHGNFFELGGDSILSIQVVSRARREGLLFTPRQLFQHQTIAGLAAVAERAAALAPAAAEAVAGPVPLTPIQAWFFEAELADPHHWNQAVLLEPPRPLHPRTLTRASR